MRAAAADDDVALDAPLIGEVSSVAAATTEVATFDTESALVGGGASHEDTTTDADADGGAEAGGVSSTSPSEEGEALAVLMAASGGGASPAGDVVRVPAFTQRRSLSKHSSDDELRMKMARPTDRWGFIEVSPTSVSRSVSDIYILLDRMTEDSTNIIRVICYY